MLLKPCNVYNTRQYKYMKPFTQYTYITFKFNMNSLGVLVYVHFFCKVYTWCLLFIVIIKFFCLKMLTLAPPNIISGISDFLCKYEYRSIKK